MKVTRSPAEAERTKRRLATSTRTAHENLNGTHAVFDSFSGGVFSSDLSSERGVLAGTAEALAAGAGPADRVAHRVGDGDDRVVERRKDINVSGGNVLLALLDSLDGAFSSCAGAAAAATGRFFLSALVLLVSVLT